MHENQGVIGSGVNLSLYYIHSYLCRALKCIQGIFRPETSPASVCHHKWVVLVFPEIRMISNRPRKKHYSTRRAYQTSKVSQDKNCLTTLYRTTSPQIGSGPYIPGFEISSCKPIGPYSLASARGVNESPFAHKDAHVGDSSASRSGEENQVAPR